MAYNSAREPLLLAGLSPSERLVNSQEEGFDCRSRHITRRTALQLIAGQALATQVTFAKPAKVQKRAPNVVFVLADDVGYGDFACLGNPYIKTPNIDSMHARSVRFTDFHVSPTCSPSRASLMTGKYCNSVGVWHTIMGRSILQPGVATLADCFKSSGYRTGLFGKWHLGDNYPCRAQDRGFDEVVVCGGGGIWQTPDYFGNDDRNDSYRHNGRFEKYEGFSTNVFFDQAMKFMAAAQDASQPFFCYVPTTASHIPTWALEKDTLPYEHVPGLTQPGFYGMTVEIDADFGRLVKFLDDRGLRENTILIFATDNGGADGVKVFNAGMRGEKGSPYEGGHRVPLFVEWPGRSIGGGRDVNTLTKDIDLLPTLVDLCGLQNHGTEPDGHSLRPLLVEEHHFNRRKLAGPNPLRRFPTRRVVDAVAAGSGDDAAVAPGESNAQWRSGKARVVRHHQGSRAAEQHRRAACRSCRRTEQKIRCVVGVHRPPERTHGAHRARRRSRQSGLPHVHGLAQPGCDQRLASEADPDGPGRKRILGG